MRAYVDSSALVKRVLDEPERERLLEALRGIEEADDILVSSSLTSVEVSRTVRSRLDAEPPARVVAFVDIALSGVLVAPMTDQILGVARRLGPSNLRSLDAIHLATATLLDVDVVVAYDQRLIQSAEELGFRTLSP